MYKNQSGWLVLVSTIALAACTVISTTGPQNPIHLDDIHYIVTDEDEAVAFFKEHFGGREMAHPGECHFKLA